MEEPTTRDELIHKINQLRTEDHKSPISGSHLTHEQLRDMLERMETQRKWRYGL